MSNTNIAFLLTIIAGLSTIIGIIPCFLSINKEKEIISISLSFASGVMLSISILDLIPESFKLISISLPVVKIIIIFISIITGILISNLINTHINKKNNNNLYKVGIISMIAIIIHNIPEGIITFITTTKNIKIGITLAIAIALHNIPEGISISIPIYYSTNNKFKAVLYTIVSGLSELLGAIITYLFLYKIINNNILGILLSITAGIMIHISLSELLPNSLNYNNKLPKYSFLIGIIVIIINLIINN